MYSEQQYTDSRMTEPKTEVVIIRLSSSEKEAFKEAASLSGIGLSSWVRERLRRTAARELGEVGREAAFITSLAHRRV